MATWSHPSHAGKARTPPTQPWWWIDRHVHKNGGTTIRGVMTMLASPGNDVSQHPGHGLLASRFRASRGILPQLEDNTTHHNRTCEVHEEAEPFAAVWMWLVDSFRSTFRVVLTTRTRRPVDHYISAWMWAGEPRYRAWNRTFTWWAPRNLQSNLMLLGDFPHWTDGSKQARIYDAFDDAAYARLQALLSRFDLVWPLERWEDGLLALARMLGWSSAITRQVLASKSRAPRHGSTDGVPIDHAAEELRLCGAAGCGELVAELAPFDAKLHAWVQACFQDDGQWACHRQQAKWTPRNPARPPRKGSATLRGLCGNNKQMAGCKRVSVGQHLHRTRHRRHLRRACQPGAFGAPVVQAKGRYRLPISIDTVCPFPPLRQMDDASPSHCGATGDGARRQGVTNMEQCVARCQACGDNACRFATYSKHLDVCILHRACDTSNPAVLVSVPLARWYHTAVVAGSIEGPPQPW
jgi:hypothetical protein